MKILLHDNSLNLRGTSVAVHDYAIWLKNKYDIECLISYFKNDPNNNDSVVKKFNKHFEIIPLNSPNDIDKEIQKNQIDLFYAIKAGSKDEIVASNIKTAIHAVFPCSTDNIHGNVYAYVSEWLAKECSNNTLPYVQHMVYMPVIDKNDNFRKTLNIPNDATVYGRYGGIETFDIPFVYHAIENIVKNNTKIYFVFCNTYQFITHPQVIFTNSVVSLEQKVKFINTCDAMIHARQRGETFGLSVIEFMSQGKPILTYGNSLEKNHYLLLKDKGIFYNTYEDLLQLFKNYKPEQIHYDNLNLFAPEIVIDKFYNIFIK